MVFCISFYSGFDLTPEPVWTIAQFWPVHDSHPCEFLSQDNSEISLEQVPSSEQFAMQVHSPCSSALSGPFGQFRSFQREISKKWVFRRLETQKCQREEFWQKTRAFISLLPSEMVRSTLPEDFALAGPKTVSPLPTEKSNFSFFWAFVALKMPFRRVTAKHVSIQCLFLPENTFISFKNLQIVEPLVSEIFFCNEKFYVRHKLPLFRF